MTDVLIEVLSCFAYRVSYNNLLCFSGSAFLFLYHCCVTRFLAFSAFQTTRLPYVSRTNFLRITAPRHPRPSWPADRVAIHRKQVCNPFIMSIQNPINIFTNKSSVVLHDKDSIILRSASDPTEPSDEDKLNFIALSLPPFSPFSDSAVKIATETNTNATTSVLQSTNGQSDYVVPATGPAVDVDPRVHSSNAETKTNKNKRKKDQSTASSVSKRQVLGEGDSRSFQGKTNCAFSSSGFAAISVHSRSPLFKCEYV